MPIQNSQLNNTLKYINRTQRLSLYFHSFINPDDFTRIFALTWQDNEFIKVASNPKYYPNGYYNLYENDETYTDTGFALAASHWCYSFSSQTKDEKVKLLSEDEYIKKLEKSIIRQCQLRSLISAKERISFYSHVPSIYTMHALVSFWSAKLNDKHQEAFNYNKLQLFEYNSCCKMVSIVESILEVAENGDLCSSYSLFRTLIETFFTYLAIRGNEKAAKEYYKFLQYQQSYETNKKYPEEFLKKCPKDVDKRAFLNYGWLKAVNKKIYSYSFASVFSACPKKEARMGNYWLDFYGECNKYVHGNLFGFIDLSTELLHLSTCVAPLFINISRYIALHLDTQPIYEDINLEETLIEEHEDLLKILSNTQKPSQNQKEDHK